MDDIVKAINQALSEYSDEVDEIMQSEIKDIAKETVTQLKNDPVIPTRTGKYKKSFFEKQLVKKTGVYKCVIANKEAYLTYLLEKGHTTRNGGRTKAFPHWTKAQKNIDKLAERIERRLKNGN